MPYKISGFVSEESVPRQQRNANPEVAEIAKQLMEAADAEDTRFAFIPVEDKIERNRLGNSIRNQVKLRGYDFEKVSGTKQRKLKSGGTDTVVGLYVRAMKPVVETPAPKKRRNGTA